jgi:tetratricopeptide (TPR) repeat protein
MKIEPQRRSLTAIPIKGVALAAFLLGLFVVSTWAQDEPRAAAATWQVEKYDVTVTPPSGERDRAIAVTANLSLKNVSGKPATQLTLRMSPSADVSSIKVNGSVLDFARSEQNVSGTTALQNRRGRISTVAAGETINVTVDYKLGVRENNSLASISGPEVRALPLSFWYPTPNSWFYVRGADAAPTRIQIASVNGLTGVSSGTAASGAFDQRFSVQPFFVTGSWDIVEKGGVSVHMPKGAGADANKRAEEMAALLTEARSFAANYLGDVPVAPLRIVAVEDAGGYSSAGTVLIDAASFRRSKLDPITVMSLAEAAARTWIGGSVPVTGEAFGVVREGLTRHIANEFLESKFGRDIADVERLRQRSSYAGVSKRDAPLSKASTLDDFYYQAVANKGAMAWRLIEKRVGRDEFRRLVKASFADRDANLAELRQAFSGQRELVDYLFDQLTETNLLIGLPQQSGGETKVALRNTGMVDATVNVRATLANGTTMDAPATVRATSYGELAFKTPNRVTRVEIDTEKLFPQTDYSDDIAPRESTDSNPVNAVKQLFDRKDFAAAETLGKTVLRDMPRLDDVRLLVARAQLALGKTAEADREFQAIIDEKLPTARSVGWALVGRGEAAAKNGSKDQAVRLIQEALAYDADPGSILAARRLRSTLGLAGSVDPAIRTFFADFDRAAKSNRKPELEAMFLSGVETRFIGGIAGSTEEWKTEVRYTDRIDNDTMTAETYTNLRLLTKEPEAGLVVYRLKRSGSTWKIASVDIFEVSRGG